MKIIDWPLLFPPLLMILLVYHSWKDIKYLYIETRDLVALTSFALVNTAFLILNQNYKILISNLFGALFCFGFFLTVWLVTKKRGIGEGELFYAPLAYFNIGLTNSIQALYICFISAMSFVVIGLISKKLKKTQALAFIPFLSIGLILSLLIP
jgi:prepilin signal peptidase PulO-like enzyme (type II secretory pathway)